MSNPLTMEQTVTQAYAEGDKQIQQERAVMPAANVKYGAGVFSDKLGTPVTYVQASDQRPINHAPISTGSHPSLPKGFSYNHRGTTVYKPKREDIEVERVLGENKYEPKKDPRSNEELLLISSRQDSEIKELKAAINGLLAGIKGIQPAPDTTPEPERVKEEPKATDELSIKDLRAEAKKLNITAPVGTTKIELARKIYEAKEGK